MQQIFRLWYIESGPWVIQKFLGTIRAFDGTFAIADTWKNIGRPLFQDYTWQGRVIGVFLRLARIGMGAFFYFLTALVYGAAWIIWLVLPLLFLISLVGGFIGPTGASL